jgi:MFS family permease
METIFSLIEPFGRYQKKTLIIVGLSSTLAAMTIYTTIFTAAKPDLICTSLLSNYTKNLTTCEIWMNFTRTEKMNKTPVYKCEFDKKYYDKTIITEFGLVCNLEYRASLAQSLYMIGGFSVLFSGWFGDRFGRRKSTSGFLILLTATLVISQLIQADIFVISVSIRYIAYCVTQFLTGAFSFSMYTSSYVLLMELTTEEYHTLFSIINLYLYIFGELISVLISYYIREWEIINWILMSCSVMMIFLIQLFLPESPRWLVSSGQYDRAYKSIVHISRYNGKKFNAVNNKINTKIDFLDAFDCISNLDEGEGNKNIKIRSIKMTLKEIIYPKRNFLKTFLLGIIWYLL